MNIIHISTQILNASCSFKKVATPNSGVMNINTQQFVTKNQRTTKDTTKEGSRPKIIYEFYVQGIAIFQKAIAYELRYF